MPFLVTAVVLIAVLCLLNLLLTFGVIRKLRAQADEKADRVADGLIIPAGSAVPGFSAVTTAGERITREGLGETMLGFFSPDCRACKERLLLRGAGAHHGPRDRSQRPRRRARHRREAREQVAALSEVAHVVVEPGDGPLGEAFDITGYPVFGLITVDGTLSATAFDPGRLPAPSKATVRPGHRPGSGRTVGPRRGDQTRLEPAGGVEVVGGPDDADGRVRGLPVLVAEVAAEGFDQLCLGRGVAAADPGRRRCARDRPPDPGTSRRSGRRRSTGRGPLPPGSARCPVRRRAATAPGPRPPRGAVPMPVTRVVMSASGTGLAPRSAR
ncbi:hypothetical protein O1M63_10200 [Streptomyces mirabilis]|nr:hypothetical protein [Streptomyces mirabilis]